MFVFVLDTAFALVIRVSFTFAFRFLWYRVCFPNCIRYRLKVFYVNDKIYDL